MKFHRLKLGFKQQTMGDLAMENRRIIRGRLLRVQQWEFLKYHPFISFYYIDETNDDTPLKKP